LQIALSLQQAREELDQVKEELAAAKAHTDQVGFPRLEWFTAHISTC
jgi:hypothetical protein